MPKFEKIGSEPLAELQFFSPGQFIKLNHGWTNYERLPASGEGRQWVVVVHGYLGQVHLVKPLAEAIRTTCDLNVLLFDLYGHGYSSSGEAVYDADLFVGQLHELISALPVQTPVHLVGHSMGGAIATCFANKYPQLLRSLTLIVPAGLGIFKPLTYYLGVSRGIGDFLMKIASSGVYSRQIRSWYRHDPVARKREEDWNLELNANKPGFVAASLALVRQFPWESLKDTYSKSSEAFTGQILTLTTTNDWVLPPSTYVELKRLLPNARHVELNSATHFMPTEIPQDLAALFKQFLDDCPQVSLAPSS